MVDLKKHLDMLGMRVEDRVTGFKGVVSSVGLTSTVAFKRS